MSVPRTIRELQGGPPGMDGNEFASWKELYRRSPFGPVRGDMQAGIVARAIHMGAGRRSLPPLDDFVIYARRRKPRESAEAEDESFALIAAQSGIPFTPGTDDGSS